MERKSSIRLVNYCDDVFTYGVINDGRVIWSGTWSSCVCYTKYKRGEYRVSYARLRKQVSLRMASRLFKIVHKSPGLRIANCEWFTVCLDGGSSRTGILAKQYDDYITSAKTSYAKQNGDTEHDYLRQPNVFLRYYKQLLGPFIFMANNYVVTSIAHLNDNATVIGTVNGVPVTVQVNWSAITAQPTVSAFQAFIAPIMLQAAQPTQPTVDDTHNGSWSQ